MSRAQPEGTQPGSVHLPRTLPTDSEPHSTCTGNPSNVGQQLGCSSNWGVHKPLTTGVTTGPPSLSQALGLWVRQGPLTISGLQPEDEADCSCSAGRAALLLTSEGASEGQEEVTPSPELLPHPHVGSHSTTCHHVCALPLPVSALSHTRAGSAQQAALDRGVTVNRDAHCGIWSVSIETRVPV